MGDRVDQIELRPGVAFCLRRFHVLFTELVRGAWVQYIRRVKANADVLGSTTDLSRFMFGAERANLGVLRSMLADLQAGQCFYCGRESRDGAADVDHFVPCSRYPVDLGHNFVLAHAKCNESKGSMLAAEEHLAKWTERNRAFGTQIAADCDAVDFTHDFGGTVQVARWAYERAYSARSLTWAGGRELVPLAGHWRTLLVQVKFLPNVDRPP